MTQAIIAINYDPTKLKVTNVAEGSLIPADWIDFSNDTSKPGQIVVSESNITPSGNLEPITSTPPERGGADVPGFAWCDRQQRD